MTNSRVHWLLLSGLLACGTANSGWIDDVTAGKADAGSGARPSADGGAGQGSGGATSGGNGSGSGSTDDAGGGAGGSGGSGGGGGANDGGATPPPSDPDAGDPYSTPAKCTSGRTWLLFDVGSPEMHPGGACDSCHKLGGTGTKYPFDISGTVYATAHEPNDCYGATGASVVITDANGQDHTLAVNGAGNFYNFNYVGVGAIPTPYRAKVVANGKERVMVTPQTNGDCNACHSQNGAQAAQGRVLLP